LNFRLAFVRFSAIH